MPAASARGLELQPSSSRRAEHRQQISQRHAGRHVSATLLKFASKGTQQFVDGSHPVVQAVLSLPKLSRARGYAYDTHYALKHCMTSMMIISRSFECIVGHCDLRFGMSESGEDACSVASRTAVTQLGRVTHIVNKSHDDCACAALSNLLPMLGVAALSLAFHRPLITRHDAPG